MLKHDNTDFAGKTVALSGFGNVAWGACIKISQLGGKVVTLSGPDGYIYDPAGIKGEKIDYLVEMLNMNKGSKVKDFADKFEVEFFPGEKPWGVKVDIIMPCAIQNDIRIEDAKKIVENGIKYVCEGANMPTTNEALAFLQANGVIVGPAKAANAGGVATSALEMSQNSMRLAWTSEEVDEKLHQIMINIHSNSMKAAGDFGFGYNLVAGANIAGFVKVASAMHAQGNY